MLEEEREKKMERNKNHVLQYIGFFCLFMFCLLYRQDVFAAEKADTTWYQAGQKEFAIDSAEELAGLAAIVNGTAEGVEQDDFSGKTITLQADIDLGGIQDESGWSGTEWTPIGQSAAAPFKGVFDGNGKKIENIYISQSTGNNLYYGLFGYVSGFGVIKNVNIVSGSVTSTSRNGYLGALAGSLSGQAVVMNCSNSADVKDGRQNYTGGIVGTAVAGTKIYNCCNHGKIAGAWHTGGIVGYNGSDITNCYNTGDVSSSYVNTSGSTSTEVRVGGVLGTPSAASCIERCYNSGSVTSEGYNGGIAGQGQYGSYGNAAYSEFENCFYVKIDDMMGIGVDSSEREGILSCSAEELKALPEGLKQAFAVDLDNLNSGYPVLNWQIPDETGKNNYEEELEDLTIASLEVSNGTIQIEMNRLLNHTLLTRDYFTIQASSGQDDINLEINTCNQEINKQNTTTVVNVGFTSLQASWEDKEFTISVSFGSQQPQSGTFTISASQNWTDYAADSFDGGEGTYENPYEIRTAEQLAYLASQVNKGISTYTDKYFILTADIDLAKSDLNNKELLWTPIRSFRGNLNGQNHTIANMKVNSSSNYAGLFGSVNGKIINLQLKDAVVNTTGDYAGVLAGNASPAEIRNVHVLSGEVEGDVYVGGIVGKFAGDGSLSDAYTLSRYDMDRCSSKAAVTGAGGVGGLVGSACQNTKTTSSQACDRGKIQISNCYATGDVTLKSGTSSSKYAGALVGMAGGISYSRITNCYASGTVYVVSGRGVGGLIGDPWGDYDVKDVIVSNNVVLTPEITGTMASGYSAGRIGGQLNKKEDDLLAVYQNNYALNSMQLLGEVVENGKDGLQGISKSQDELSQRSTWEELDFDFSESGEWKWDEETKRPLLKDDPAIYEIYITTQPHDAVCYENKAAIYETDAVFGVGELTYTWQRKGGTDSSWQNISEGNGSKRIEINAIAAWDNSSIRCMITDEAGTTVYTTTVSLNVYEGKLSAETAMEQLYELYEANGISTICAPFAAYDVSGDISNINIDLTYKDDYYSSSTDYGEDAWAVLDYIARGKNPLNFIKDGEGNKNPETVNFIAELLKKQNNHNTGSFTDEENYRREYLISNVYYTLALDIFYAGAEAWNNEDVENAHGRTAAITYLLNCLKVDEESNGKVFLSKKTIGTKPDGTGAVTSILRKQALVSNADFAILMARLSDDTEFGEQAKCAMKDVLTMLTYEYEQRTFDAHTEAMAHYLSALVAASNVADKDTYLEQADEVYHQLLNAVAFDGTYAASTVNDSLQESGDEDATAAVLMAFADYAKETCLLAELNYESNTEDLIEADMNAITIPSTVTGNLNLPVKGSNGTEFVWTSSKENVIAVDGTVNRQSKDTTVVLTVKATLNGVTVEKSYKVIVAKQQVEGGDDVAAAIEKLSLLPEYITDIDLPDTGANDTSIYWSSSDPGIISSSGKVTRPAVGSKDAVVTLTATVSKGEASDTKTFDVKVWSQVDTSTTEGLIKEAYYTVRKKSMNTTVLNGYWEVWTAYAALGEQITDFDYTYNTTNNSSSQVGAHVLALVALGENPYDYRGVNYVQRMLNKGMSAGGWSVPIFNTLGAEAAGVKNVSMPLNEVSGWLINLGLGPDLGGWACVPISRHVNDSADYREKLNTFLDAVKTDMAYNLDTSSGGSPILSKGCVVTGLSALYASGVKVNIDGIQGLNPAFDKPWVSDGAVKEMCESIIKSQNRNTFSYQTEMEICDLYNVLYNNRNVGWIQCGVSKAKLQEQIAKARDILAEKDSYSESIISDIETALKAAENISGERLNQEIADYGEEYYALYDAVRAAEGKKMNYPEEEDPDDGNSTGGSQIGGAVDGGSNVGQQQPGAQQSGSQIVNSGNAAETSVKLAKAAWRTPQLKSRIIKLRWKKVKKADGYEIYMRKSKKGKYKRIKNIKNVKKLTYVKKGLKKGKTYYFRIRAYKKVGGQKVYGNFSRTLKVRCR